MIVPAGGSSDGGRVVAAGRRRAPLRGVRMRCWISSLSRTASETCRTNSSGDDAQLAQVQAQLQHVVQRVEQAQRRLRVRRAAEVVRRRRPDARRRQLGAQAGVVQHADDAGRALVARAGDAAARELRLHAVVGAEAGERHRARVHGVRDQRAERDEAPRADGARQARDLAAEAAPLEVRLGADASARPPATCRCRDRRRTRSSASSARAAIRRRCGSSGACR